MNKPMILVVEDDHAVRNLITTTLELKQYKFHTAETGGQAVLETASQKPDIILLDLGLPDLDGVEVIRKVRSWSNVPIIVISARNDDHDKIEALDAGADDYLTKPFSVDELLARLRVTLRRLSYIQNSHPAEESVFVNGDLKIDYTSGCVFVEDRELHLTPIEYKLLCLLAKNVGKVLTHTYLLREVWGSDNRSGSCLALSIRVIELCKLQEHPALPSHRGFAQDAVVGRFSLSRLCNRLQQPVLNKLLYA